MTFVVRRGNGVVRVEVRLGRRPPPGERRYENFGRVEPSPNGPNTPTAAPSPYTGRTETPVRPNVLPPETLPDPGVPTDAAAAAPQTPPPGEGRMLLGVRAVPVSPEIQKALALPHARGSLVVEVRPGSPAQQAGLPLEAVITEIDGIRVDTPQALADVVNTKGFGADVRLSFYRFGQMQEKTIRLGGAAAAAGPTPSSVPMPIAPPALQPPPPSVPPPPSPNNEAEALRRQIRELEARLKALESQPKP